MSAPRSEHGGALLFSLLALSLLMLLVVAGLHRAVLAEQRASANQFRATEAFETAEGGLEWTLAQLNGNEPLDAHCQAAPETADDGTFNERHGWSALWRAEAARQEGPRCTASGDAPLQCRCPRPGNAAEVPQQANPPPQRSFDITIRAASRPGDATDLMQITATACVGPSCSPLEPGRGDARAESTVLVGRIPTLAVDPAAALTVKGSLRLGNSPWVVGTGASGPAGVAVRAGGIVQAPRLIVVVAPGAPREAARIEGDRGLHEASVQSQFMEMFRLERHAWQSQPSVRRVDCQAACDLALQAALGARTHHAVVWLPSGLNLRAGMQIGSPERPVLLVIDGPVQLEAATVIHGLVYITSTDWKAAAGTVVHGAVVAAGDLRGQGATQIFYDATTLRRLKDRAGTWARVSGSWKDF